MLYSQIHQQSLKENNNAEYTYVDRQVSKHSGSVKLRGWLFLDINYYFAFFMKMNVLCFHMSLMKVTVTIVQKEITPEYHLCGNKYLTAIYR